MADLHPFLEFIARADHWLWPEGLALTALRAPPPFSPQNGDRQSAEMGEEGLEQGSHHGVACLLPR